LILLIKIDDDKLVGFGMKTGENRSSGESVGKNLKIGRRKN